MPCHLLVLVHCVFWGPRLTGQLYLPKWLQWMWHRDAESKVWLQSPQESQTICRLTCRTSLLRHHGPKNMSSIWKEWSENKSHHTLRAYFHVTNMQKINVLWCKGLFIMDTAADAVDDTEEKKNESTIFRFPVIFWISHNMNLCCHKIKCIKAAVRNLALKRLINRTVCVFWKNVVARATYRLCL